MLYKKELIITIILILSSLLAIPAHSLQYVASASDFQLHIQLHRRRVVLLGSYLAKQEFPEISAELAENFLLLHDTSKTLKQTITSLYAFYGKNNLDADQLADLKKTITFLNSIDTAYADSFFDTYQLSSLEREQLLLIEKIADLVDRSMDPVAEEEFGRKMKLASEFIQDANQNTLAKLLESKYKDLIRDYSMKPLGSCQRIF